MNAGDTAWVLVSAGFFGDKSVNSIGANGLFYGGGGHLLGEQVLAIVVVVAFSFGMTWIIAITVAKTIGLRVVPADERHLDQVQEGLPAYARASRRRRARRW